MGLGKTILISGGLIAGGVLVGSVIADALKEDIVPTAAPVPAGAPRDCTAADEVAEAARQSLLLTQQYMKRSSPVFYGVDCAEEKLTAAGDSLEAWATCFEVVPPTTEGGEAGTTALNCDITVGPYFSVPGPSECDRATVLYGAVLCASGNTCDGYIRNKIPAPSDLFKKVEEFRSACEANIAVKLDPGL